MRYTYLIALVWICLLCPMILPAQTYYFNNRYNLYPFNTWDYAKTILEVDDGYIISSATGGDNNLRTLALTKLNMLGQVEWSKYMADSNTGYSPGYSGSLSRYAENVYFGAGIARSYTSNWVHDRGLLIKYNSEFETLWKKEYGETSAPFDTSYLFRNLTFALDGGIAITGSWVEYSTGIMNAHAYFLKTDTSGNKLWEHVYTNLPGDVQGYSVISTTDGGYAIGAFQYYHVPPPNETGDPLVIKTDSLGNFEWVKNLGGGFIDTHAMLAQADDGYILASCGYADSMSNPYEGYKRHRITKLGNDGEVVWDRFYLKPQYYMNPLNIRVGNDGSIITTGRTMITFPLWASWIMKCKSNGDSLWYREYRLLQGEDSDNCLYDAIPTSDNGYIACGYVNPVLPDTGTQDIWVVKVDSLGCESPTYCWVGVKELPAAPKLGELIVFPNPAKDVFMVQFQQINKKSVLQFVDIIGRKVDQISISPSETTQTVNCSHWPPGIYLGQLVSDGKIVAKGKVVVK